ncbi:Ternary complex factor MIP1 [Vigna unguiculata]|uniref:Ternary complex factor MIP1 n=2 Tax=Vigna unguiculata TaxID=3917 RepID=A0A4D6MI98_VIGUN|nr:Ternary complex factor MIP1 [Vigna unguiculata]
MKFEDYLMEKSQEPHNRQSLEKEVVQLQAQLKCEEALNRILRCALHGPVFSLPLIPPLFPPQIRELLQELAKVEEEIIMLESKVQELKLRLFLERYQNMDLEIQHRRQQQPKLYKQFRGSSRHGSMITEQRSSSLDYEVISKERKISNRRASLGSALDFHSLFSTPRRSTEYEVPRRSSGKIAREYPIHIEDAIEKPNEMSEELLKCLIGIFLELNKASLDREESETVPRLTLPCMKSTGLIAKTSSNSKAPSNSNVSCLDPYGISSDLDCTARDVGPYKDFIQITRSSLDIDRFSQCLPAFRKLRVLMHKLCDVDLSFLTYKQKLAFWINIYNACIMNAFLDHGLPSTQEKLLSLMNKAAMNVGGIVLNALAIEHFILRHPSESKHGAVDEKEVLLRHAYGLGYPEPNVTFALCRGTWSSPALRVYTSDEVVNQLGRAKVEYLEASVGITNKRKIVVPKLLEWHMHDFADEMESLLEWIYSQLPRSGSLKRATMESLIRETKYPMSKMVEVQPYESEFRYLLPI